MFLPAYFFFRPTYFFFRLARKMISLARKTNPPAYFSEEMGMLNGKGRAHGPPLRTRILS